MRSFLFLLCAGAALAQQPILYQRGTVNAASLAPFGLPNAPIARGSIFTIFGEKLGPATGQSVSAFPLDTTFQGVAISVTQNGTTKAAYPIFVSANQVNAIMPSSITPGLATVRLFYNNVKSNATTIQIADSAPGIFAVSSGGFGPAIIQNFVAAANQPINSTVTSASPGQTITIWGTGLGPVTFPDNVAPTAGNVAAPVAVTIGGQPATIAYSGRSPCCSGVDQIVVTVPNNAPLGCWVPVLVKAGGVVSNTTTMAIAAPGAVSCSDPFNPLSQLVRTSGTQAFIQIGRSDKIDNIKTGPSNQEIVDKLYSRFFTRPGSPYNFDAYMSLPPSGTCLVHQTSGDISNGSVLRGVLPPSASTSQPNQAYTNGTQILQFSPTGAEYSSTLGGTVQSKPAGMSLLGPNANYTVDPGGPNQKVIPLNVEPPATWTRSAAILAIPRDSPLILSFSPADALAPTAIVVQSYSAVSNATVQVQCLAPPGANAFTIPADVLANLPTSYLLADGSYTNLFIGSPGFTRAVPFTNGLAANGILLVSSWIGQTVVIQ